MPLKQTLHHINEWWLRYEYKHTTLFILWLMLFVVFFDSAIISGLLRSVEGLGYVGAGIAGVLSVSFFTAAPAAIALIGLADRLDPIALAIVAGAGAMVGDWLLLQFFEERIFHELKPIFIKLHIHHLLMVLQHKATRWILLVLGAFVIMTPLPDEIGIGLLGISHVKPTYLLMVTFVLNTLGLLALVAIVRAV